MPQPTRERLEQALRAADAAGDTAAATQFAQALRGMKPDFVGPVATGQEMARSFEIGKPQAPGVMDIARLLGTPQTRLGLGAGEAAASIGTGMVASPINSFWNAMMEAGELPTGQPVGTYQPRTPEGQGILKGVDQAMRLTGVPQLLEKGMDLENPDPAVRATGNLIGGALGVLPAVGPLKSAAARRAAIPTRAEIKLASREAYQRAEQSGGMLPQQNLGSFAAKAEQMLSSEGVDATLHPKTMAAFNRIMEDATKPGIAGHSVQGAEILRKVLSNAETEAIMSAGGQVSSDARLAGKLLDDFDDFMDQQLPSASAEYQTARSLWNVQRKSQDIETLFERAKNQSGQFSMSGMENALTTQFRQLANNPRRLGRFTPAEQAAIKDVARGTWSQKSLRLLGKFAPTGTVPAIAALGAEGVMPGSGLALAGLGIAGKAGATALRTRAARAVDELIRKGALPNLPQSRLGVGAFPATGYLPAAALGTEEADQDVKPETFAEFLRRR